MKDVPFKTKLRSYSLLTGSLLATGFSADAQIVYTDVIPDDTLTAPGAYYPLDLNNDSIVDFYLTDGSGAAGYLRGAQLFNAMSGSVNSAAGIFTYNTNSISVRFPFKLSCDDTIDSALGWVKPTKAPEYLPGAIDFGLGIESHALLNVIALSGEYIYGYWTGGVQDHYLGLRLNIDSNSYYGWVRLDCASDAMQMIVKDYAINSQPNESILACVTVGINQIKNVDVTVFPNPVSSKLFISGLNENFNDAEVSVLDLSGRKIISQKISSSQNEIDVSALPNGIYLLELNNEDGMLTKKFEVAR